MPAKWFRCSDGEKTEISKCLSVKGCRLGNRCATMPYLRAVAFDREWKGISPSSAGSDARYLWLKATRDYAVDPNNRAFAILGTAVHQKLSLHSYNVLSEETLSDGQMAGIADLLEEDEYDDGYILSDYKTFGSFKAAKCLGIATKTVEVCDDNGEPIRFKSGKREGQIKTRKEIEISKKNIDMDAEIMQLNRYRIFFEREGFPISKMQLFIIVRDGGTASAFTKQINNNIYMIPIKRLDDIIVFDFYDDLDQKVKTAFETGYAPECSKKLKWNGNRCKKCEVRGDCRNLAYK